MSDHLLAALGISALLFGNDDERLERYDDVRRLIVSRTIEAIDLARAERGRERARMLEVEALVAELQGLVGKEGE